MVHEMKDAGKASPLFEGWEETLIWSCLQGVMGKIYADDPDHPTAVMAVIGDFTFFAGKPDTELASFKPGWCKGNFRILVPQDRAWEDRILEIYGEKAKITSRYAIKKEPDIFDREKLKRIVSLLPEGYELSMIDEYLYHMCRSQSWSADLVSQWSVRIVWLSPVPPPIPDTWAELKSRLIPGKITAANPLPVSVRPD